MPSSHSPLVLGLLASLLLTTFAPAESASQYALYRSEDHAQSWSRSDLDLPRDSRINAFAASAQTFIAGTDAGIFISTNDAKSWHPAAETKSYRVTSLANLDQQNFAGTSNGILLSSIDHGFTWQRNPTFQQQSIRSLHAFDGSIYVGTDAHHVYQSADRGRTWTRASTGLPAQSSGIAFLVRDNIILAAVHQKPSSECLEVLRK